MMPAAVDLFCGLGGWTEGLLAEGYKVVGFDIEEHIYGEHKYPGKLILADVLILHGSLFARADLIVASPPCQEYSYMAMPWKRAKAKAAMIRADMTGKELARLTALFNACFRIQREACEAAGRHIPMVVENVKGAQPWVGKAAGHFGSFYLWGDVPSLPVAPKAVKNPGLNWSAHADPDYCSSGKGACFRDTAIKNTGGSWFNIAHNTTSGKGQNPDGRKVPTVGGGRSPAPGNGERFTSRDCGTKNGNDWFGSGENCSEQRRHASGSKWSQICQCYDSQNSFAIESAYRRNFQTMTFWLDTKRNIIAYKGEPGILERFIPDLKRLNGSYFAFPRTLPNLQAAAFYNWPVPPIMTDETYDWPIERGKTPLPHQKTTANFVALHQRCFVLSDPGTMKTLSTLWAIDWLMLHAKERFRCLVVAPLTILETTWANAIFRNFLNRRSFEILTGTPERRLKRLESDVDIFLINHDGIKVGAHLRRKVDPRNIKQKRIELDGFSKALAERSDIKLVVLDEAHGFGDPSSARSGVANMMFGVGKRPMLKQLTGTPNATAPTDAYGMAKLANNAYGKSFTGFRYESMMKITEFKWVPQKDGYEKARRLLTPAIRFGLDEIWTGPPMTFQRRKIELTDEQKKEMKRLRNELQVIAASGQAISAANESAARQKLIQLSLGAVYDGDHVAHLIDASPRYHELREIVESTERKVVVFVPITSVVHLVVKYLRDEWKKHKKPWKCDFINGEVKAGKERDAVINNFVSDPDFKLVVADPQTATEGINEFVIADTVVWFGATDRAKAWIQGNARVRRPGQKYPSVCFQLVSNKLEEEIFDRLETNTSMQGMMLDAIRKGEF